jgi:hypothetical protein
MKVTTVWDVTPHSLVEFTGVSKERQGLKTSTQQAEATAGLSSFLGLLFNSEDEVCMFLLHAGKFLSDYIHTTYYTTYYSS